MNQAWILLIVLLISSCATTEPYKNCPQMEINTEDPDFSKKYKLSAINDFYGCRIANTPEKKIGGLIGAATNSRYPTDKDSLRYQLILWRQVLAKERSSNAAQEAWVIWQSNRKDAASTAAALDLLNSPSHKTSVPMTCMANGPFINCH